MPSFPGRFRNGHVVLPPRREVWVPWSRTLPASQPGCVPRVCALESMQVDVASTSAVYLAHSKLLAAALRCHELAGYRRALEGATHQGELWMSAPVPWPTLYVTLMLRSIGIDIVPAPNGASEAACVPGSRWAYMGSECSLLSDVAACFDEALASRSETFASTLTVNGCLAPHELSRELGEMGIPASIDDAQVILERCARADLSSVGPFCRADFVHRMGQMRKRR